MLSVRHLSTTLALAAVAGACSTAGLGTGTSAGQMGPMAIPVSTQSAAARDELLRGLHDLDVERFLAARQDFDRAIAADPNFALAHFYEAIAAISVPDYQRHLAEAVRLANTASPVEQLWIRMEQKSFDNDINGQRDLAEQLVRMTPTDPRALNYLAAVEFNQGKPADARATLERAIQVAPSFAPSIIALGNSYLNIEPRDAARAAGYIRQVVALEPNEPVAHDYMGDVYRAQNNLPQAHAEYTRMIELDPSRGEGFSQRGHVNSFMGNFAAARADYDRAMALQPATDRPGTAVFRALVSVYAGDPRAAESELDRVVGTIDGLNIPNAVGSKINALSEEARIAIHSGHLEVAASAIDKLRDLFRQQGETSGSEAFKRSNGAAIDYWEGMLAARRGDYPTARSEARDMMRLLAPDQNPRKDESAHELLGMADLLQGNNQSAAAHFAQANPDDIYVEYHRALALEGAGRTAEAKALFRSVAAWNFNGSATALLKKEAARKAGGA